MSKKQPEKKMPLFDLSDEVSDLKKALLFALGEFQSRGFDLENRKIALDRLLGAFSRSFKRFRVADKEDAEIAKTLENLGIEVEEVPEYVAKHPFRMTVSSRIAARGLEIYKAELDND